MISTVAYVNLKKNFGSFNSILYFKLTLQNQGYKVVLIAAISVTVVGSFYAAVVNAPAWVSYYKVKWIPILAEKLQMCLLSVVKWIEHLRLKR